MSSSSVVVFFNIFREYQSKKTLVILETDIVKITITKTPHVVIKKSFNHFLSAPSKIKPPATMSNKERDHKSPDTIKNITNGPFKL